MSYGRVDSYRSQTRDLSNLTQTCSSNIQKITQNTGQIMSLLYQMGSGKETPELQDRLQQLQHYTNQLAKETNKHLKELGSFPQPLSPSEQRQQKIQKERLMNDFSTALNNFQTIQRRAAEKQRETVARARAGSRLTGDGCNVEEQLVTFEKDDEDSAQQDQVQTEQAPITEEDLEIIKDRETNIRQLEADIMDVNQIFKDLALMIHDQGEIIALTVTSSEFGVHVGFIQTQTALRQMLRVQRSMLTEELLSSKELPVTRGSLARGSAFLPWCCPWFSPY
ncbi:syntaxin-12 isoform X1 [Gadus macrocephalus]|uniref:syntaxin-12 isoform X1 n=1 Tax=Gadus macrocephalus TaxID=80720 RepID=UPI0028CB4E10|nr:syntaxin-12 isoform X1 [Gadus macrocephalus]